MKNAIKFLGFIALVAVAGFAMTGCKEPGEGTPALTGTVRITGNAQVGETLTANTGSLGGNGTISYQWKKGGNTDIGSNRSTYTVQTADIGSTITVTVSRSGYSGSVTSQPTAVVGLPPLSGTVNITGTAQVGQTLTANTSSLGGSGTISYQWEKGGTAIPDANGSTYTVQSADYSYIITVTVTRSGYSGNVTSDPTGMIGLPPLTGTVSITGTAQVGQTLTANTGSLGGNGTISYQWKRGTGGGTAFNIGTNSSTYVVQAADANATITVTVTRSGYSGSVTSLATGSIPIPVTFNSVTANGSATQTTTQLTLIFSQEIAGLAAGDITLSGISSVQKGSLSRSGSTYTLPISGFTAGGTLAVTVAKSGYTISGSPKTGVIINYYIYIIPIEMVSITGGTFTMGSPTNEPGRNDSTGRETQHQVTLTGFKMGKHQVTQAQYEGVMGTNPSSFKTSVSPETSTVNRPVENVTWYDAIEFCNKLSVQEEYTQVYTITGRTPATGYPITSATVSPNWNANGYRLPTEAQWEYACRAGTTTAYNTGGTISDNTGWYYSNSGMRTHTVGEKPENDRGLYDMHGNVNEWCWDWSGIYASGTQTDPTGAVSGDWRVVRGGGWSGDSQSLRSAARRYIDPANRGDYIGFRLVRP